MNGADHVIVEDDGNTVIVRPVGNWLISEIAAPDIAATSLEAQARTGRSLTIDLSELESLDTSGAWIISRLRDNWNAGGGGAR